MKKTIILLGVLVIIIISVWFFKSDKREFLTIDINPSIGLYVKDDIVDEVLFLNDEAYIALYDKELNKKSIDNVLNEILDVSIKMGYIDEFSHENIINITVYSKEESENEKLNIKIKEKIEKQLQKKDVQSLVIKNGMNEDIKEKSKTNNISYGKMLLVRKSMNIDTEINEEKLIKESEKQLKKRIRNKNDSIKNNVKEVEKRREIRIKEAKQTLESRKKQIIEEFSGDKELNEKEKKQILLQQKESTKQQNLNLKKELTNKDKVLRESIKQRINIR